MPIGSASGGKDPARDKAARASERDRNRDNAKGGGGAQRGRRTTTAVQAVGNPFAGIGSGFGTGPGSQGPTKGPPQRSPSKPKGVQGAPGPGELTASFPYADPLYGPMRLLDLMPPGPLTPVTAALKEAGVLPGLPEAMGLKKGPQMGTSPTQTRSNPDSGVGGKPTSGAALREQKRIEEEERRRRAAQTAAAQQTALGSVNELLGPGVLPI